MPIHTEDEVRALFDLLPDARARARLTEIYTPVACKLALRYRNRGIEADDLRQVALIGLLKAIDRFDLERGTRFLSFATPTITGELKRHFRDSGWGLGVPRSMKDLGLAGRRAHEELSHKLGRSPTIEEVAAAIDADPGDVAEAAALWSAYRPGALDAVHADGTGAPIDLLGECDPGFRHIDDLESLGPLLAARSETERRALYLRFYRDMSQQEIAQHLQVSQMQVSRILTGTLATLRILMNA
jgi:RNA polymerase sigma-B factor